MMASMVANGNREGQPLVLKGVDPETCMIVFKNHWTQVQCPPGFNLSPGQRRGGGWGGRSSGLMCSIRHLWAVALHDGMLL